MVINPGLGGSRSASLYQLTPPLSLTILSSLTDPPLNCNLAPEFLSSEAVSPLAASVAVICNLLNLKAAVFWNIISVSYAWSNETWDLTGCVFSLHACLCSAHTSSDYLQFYSQLLLIGDADRDGFFPPHLHPQSPPPN